MTHPEALPQPTNSPSLADRLEPETRAQLEAMITHQANELPTDRERIPTEVREALGQEAVTLTETTPDQPLPTPKPKPPTRKSQTRKPRQYQQPHVSMQQPAPKKVAKTETSENNTPTTQPDEPLSQFEPKELLFPTITRHFHDLERRVYMAQDAISAVSNAKDKIQIGLAHKRADKYAAKAATARTRRGSLGHGRYAALAANTARVKSRRAMQRNQRLQERLTRRVAHFKARHDDLPDTYLQQIERSSRLPRSSDVSSIDAPLSLLRDHHDAIRDGMRYLDSTGVNSAEARKKRSEDLNLNFFTPAAISAEKRRARERATDSLPARSTWESAEHYQKRIEKLQRERQATIKRGVDERTARARKARDAIGLTT